MIKPFDRSFGPCFIDIFCQVDSPVSPPVCDNPGEAEDYTPIHKRARHSASAGGGGANGPISSSPPLPCRESPSLQHSGSNGEAWPRPLSSPRNTDIEHRDRYKILREKENEREREKEKERESERERWHLQLSSALFVPCSSSS